MIATLYLPPLEPVCSFHFFLYCPSMLFHNSNEPEYYVAIAYFVGARRPPVVAHILNLRVSEVAPKLIEPLS